MEGFYKSLVVSIVKCFTLRIKVVQFSMEQHDGNSDEVVKD